MVKEYEKDIEDYKKIKEIYEKSLTEEQKSGIKRVKEELATAREKRKLKAVSKDLLHKFTYYKNGFIVMHLPAQFGVPCDSGSKWHLLPFYNYTYT